jgi:curved DNA-binding protein CbpA
VASRERCNLLVITRDGSVRAVLSRFLRSRGFVVKTAAGPGEARMVCDRWRPDLVVVEAHERFDRSLATLRELREAAQSIAGVPVILGCTKAPPRAAEDAARELGVAEIVPEPFVHMDELVLIAAKVLSSLEPKTAPPPAEPGLAAPIGPVEAVRPLPFPANGRLAAASVIELLHGCHAAGVSGRLTLRHGATRLVITIEHGSPCHAETSDAERSFEAFLERSGRLGPEERRLIREASSGVTLRQAILDKGLLGPHELFKALTSHLRELVVDCIAWEDGDYDLEQGAGGGGDVTPISLDPPTLIRAGIERHYDLERLERAVAASDETGLRIRERDGGGIGRGDLCLSTHEARLYDLASRGSTVGEICKAAGNRVSGLRFLLALLVMDVLDLERAPAETPPQTTGEATAIEPSAETGAPGRGEEPLAFPDALELADPLDVPESIEVAEPHEPSRPSTPPAAAQPVDAPEPSAEPEAPGPAEVGIEEEIRRLATADYFELLGLARDATTEDVHAAFRQRAARFRPEAVVDLPESVRDEAIAVYQRILEGYRVLANAQQRAKYLAALRPGPGEKARPKPEAIEVEPAPEPSERIDRLIAAVERTLADLRMTDALKMLRDARKEHSSSPRWMAWYGWALYRDDPELNLHEAERFLGRARAQAPSSPEPYLLMARIRAREGATDRAAELYRKALSHDPGSKAIARELAQLESDRKADDRAGAEQPKDGSRPPAGTLSQRGLDLVGILKRLPFGKKP